MEGVMGEMVTISIEEYSALRDAAEDLEDLLAYDRVTQALARGEDELIPAAIAERLIAGESPVRVWREYRELTQQALAEQSGVNRVQIANIEAGQATGSVATLRKLADALGLTIDDLV
jgi:DNA-binding XRE family transcriptional regulator